MNLVFAIIITAVFIGFEAETVFAQMEQCSGEKVTTMPFAGDYGSVGPHTVTRQAITNPAPDSPAPISVFIPSNASSVNKRPAIFFSHGFGGINYFFYEALLRQLASNGYVVVFTPYSASLTVSHVSRYNQLWTGFQTAVTQNSAIIDTSRVGFAGHSYGAGATPEMARRGANAGWGGNGLFMFIMAPWYNWGANMEQIPSSAKMIVQAYWDDNVNQHLIAKNDVWDRIPQLTERKWQVIRDSRTYCSLIAGHSIPTTGASAETAGALNGYDAWGVWRRMQALADYTFTNNQAARGIAFGNDAHMGRWRGLFAVRPIAPLEATDTPVMNSEIVPTFRWSEKCNFAQGSPCP